MRLISVNVGLPREVTWKGKTVTTRIFKEPVVGRVKVHRFSREGDLRADLSVHGGSVYAYPVEHYDDWRNELAGTELPWGMFGENLTVEGMLEDQVHVGDRFRIGSAVFMSTGPRVHCFGLEVNFGGGDIIGHFLRGEHTGFHFLVLREGNVCAGDTITLIGRNENSISIADLTRWYASRGSENPDLDLLCRAIRVEAMSADWRNYFYRRLEN